MEENKTPILSQQDERLLNHLTLVANILQQKTSSGADQKKRWWKPFLEPSVLTALVTVLIGGIMGNILADRIQAGSKEREFQQAWMKARGDQALLAYKEYLDQEQQTVRRAYGLVGGCISASDDLIDLTRPEFAPGSHVGIVQERTAIRKNYNDHSVQWRKDSLELQLLMNYYHPQSGQREITDDWLKVQSSVEAYMDCAVDWYVGSEGKKPPEPEQIESACKDKKEDFSQRMSQFTRSLELSRRYAWEGWESPDRLRSALEQKNTPTPTPVVESK